MNVKGLEWARKSSSSYLLVGWSLGFILMCSSCKKTSPSNEEQSAQLQKEEAALVEQTAQAARAKAEEQERTTEVERKKAEEEAALSKKQALDKMFACCEALGKEGFEQRSMTYMKGSDLCEAAQKEGKTMAEARDAIKEALGSQALPPECTQE